MLARSQKAVLTEVIKSWLLPKSNYILVCPPMNAEREIVEYLRSSTSIHEVIGDKLDSLALAKLDTHDFKSELVFAKSVAKLWDVDIENDIEDDANAILERSCELVIQQKRVPVLIIHRFHEALAKLGEDIGSTLRNLEHSHCLKTVVTMPVSLQDLRERWATMDIEKAPFLASDWGQGHKNKVLPGYSLAEITVLGKTRGIAQEECVLFFNATGGLVDIVLRTIDEIKGKKSTGLLRFLQSRSPELCARLLTWLDPNGASPIYTKTLVTLLNENFYPSDIASIKNHDWKTIILGVDNKLNFKMLAWAASEKLANSKNSSLIDAIKSLYLSDNYNAALTIIEILHGTDKINMTYWSVLRDATIFCNSTCDLFSNTGQWSIALRKLNKLLTKVGEESPYREVISPLGEWRKITELLSDFLSKKERLNDSRLEHHICSSEKRELIVPFLQLLFLRLESTQKEGSRSLQSVLTAPESLVQVYAYFEHGICFWDFPGPSPDVSIKIEAKARKPYKINSRKLGYTDLLYLIAVNEDSHPTKIKFISDARHLDLLLAQYEVRKEHAHSLSFTDKEKSEKYRECFLGMLNQYLKIIDHSIDISLFTAKNCLLGLLDYAPKAPM